MAETTVLKTIFQIRRGTAADWQKSTLILKVGEPAFAYDTGEFKVGTGDKTWNELPHSGGSSVLDLINSRLDDLEAITGSGEDVDGSKSLLDRIESLEKELGLSDGADETQTSVLERIEKVEKVINTAGEEGVIDTVVDLIDYVNSHGTTTEAIIKKLETIEDGAQVNKIEQIYIGETPLDITEEKKVTIDYANSDKGGIVKSSTGANKVSVGESGYMKVSSVNTSSLVKPFGNVLIFDGGGAFEEVFDGASLNNTIATATEGEVISLGVDVSYDIADDKDHLVINNNDVTLDLGGYTVKASGSNGAIKAEGGKVTLEGDGVVEASLGGDKYSMAVWAENGTIVINDGYYSNATDGSERGTDLIYASGTGQIKINGGTFVAAKPEWTLNCKDADYKAGTANIVVKGGRFFNFDPANNNTEGAGTNYVAEGYKSVKDGDYYIVSAQ